MKTTRKGIILRRGMLYVETPLGLINIYTGLRDSKGRRTEAVTMVPNDYQGKPSVRVVGRRFVELKGKGSERR